MQYINNIMVLTYYSHQSADNDDSKWEECYEGVGMDVGVPLLENLHEKQPSNDEHKGSVCGRIQKICI